MFEQWANVTCVKCNQTTSFHAEAEVKSLTNERFFSRDWVLDTLKTLEFDGVCPACKFDRAA